MGRMGKRQGARGKGHKAKTANRVPLTTTPRVADAALILFAKAPVPGQVKTRLCPPLTPDEAATLHGSFVLDALERSRDAMNQGRLSLDRFVACSPSPEHVFFKVLEERHHVQLLPQIGEDLGLRMQQAFRTVLGRGYGRVLLQGTDLPSLPNSRHAEALTLLVDHDVVLGPSLDGGYYLIGLTRPIPELFVDIPWSTDHVFSLTVKKTDSLGLRTALLPACRDIDRLEDVLALIEESGTDRGRGARGTGQGETALSKRTVGVLRMLATRLRTRPVPPPTP